MAILFIAVHICHRTPTPTPNLTRSDPTITITWICKCAEWRSDDRRKDIRTNRMTHRYTQTHRRMCLKIRNFKMDTLVNGCCCCCCCWDRTFWAYEQKVYHNNDIKSVTPHCLLSGIFIPFQPLSPVSVVRVSFSYGIFKEHDQAPSDQFHSTLALSDNLCYSFVFINIIIPRSDAI